MKDKRHLIRVIAMVVPVLAVFVGILIYEHFQPPKVNYTMSGGAKGKGISLFIPAQLKSTGNSSNSLKLFEEDYVGTKNSKTTLAVTSSTIADTANTIAQLKKALGSTSSAAYLKFISVQGTFAQNAAATAQQGINWSDQNQNNRLNIGTVNKFTNKNIQENAWRFDFSLSHSVSGKSAAVKVNGLLIYAIGKTAAYRLVVTSASDNWQANQATWKKIADSLRINQ